MNIERFNADERGVSEVVGAILVFALVVAMFGIIQSQAIPNQNEEIEAQHSLEVQSDLTRFHQLASSVAADGSDRSKSFNMGTGYPARLLFFNPPRVQGQLETTASQEVTISGFKASNSDVNDYMSGPSPGGSLDLPTRRLQYTVNYNEYQNDPTTRYEYGVLYNDYDTGTVIQNQGNIIDGTRINLLFMAGDYTESSTTEESLSVQGVSAPARSVTITGTGSGCGDPLVIELPTNLDPQKWQDLDPIKASNNICSPIQWATTNQDKIEIRLDPTKTYDLRMSRIGLEPGAATQTPQYIVPVDPGVTSAGVGQRASIEYEVRDQYNNPVSGAEVEFPDGSKEETNDRGRVSTTVITTQTEEYEAELLDNCASSLDRCKAKYLVQVPGLNLNPNSGVRLDKATTEDPDPNTRTGQTNDAEDTAEDDTGDAVDCEAVSCEADVTFENTNSEKVGIKTIRINHYNPNPQAHTDVDIYDNEGNSSEDIVIGGAAVSPTLWEIKPGKTHTYSFVFEGEVHEGDYFVLTIIFDNNERALYFVSPKAT